MNIISPTLNSQNPNFENTKISLSSVCALDPAVLHWRNVGDKTATVLSGSVRFSFFSESSGLYRISAPALA